ncbi:transposable element Tcb2 transposase [Trichonephila clavipes]|nr:transposable element Tcb2 transposase [Trichonephila clavipes]
MMRVWKQWTNERRITRRTGSERRKVTSAHDGRHLLCMAVNDRTASSRQLATPWSIDTGVLMLASSIRRRLRHLGLRLDNARPPVAKIVRDFCSVQHMQLLPWPACSPDMSPIQHVRDLVGRHLTRDPRPVALKGVLLLRIQAIWNSLPQADI